MRSIGYVAAIALALHGFAGARADEYPNRPIQIIVGIAAGGITDVTTRIYAEFVSRSIGQRMVIDNRPAGSGAVAAAAVQNAAPDGYTLLAFSASQHAAVPAFQAVPYDPLRFQPITLLFNLATVLVVPADSPAKTVAELFDYGRKKAGGLYFGSPGSGTPSHMLAAKIAAATGTPMEHVHYRGGSPVMADLITGRVDFSLLSYTLTRSYLAEGKLRALAVDLDQRWSALPDVPTFDEVGLGNERVASWFAIAAPVGTPPDIVRRLHDAFVTASHDPELQRRLSDNGTPIVTTTPEEMGRLLATEVADTDALVKRLGLRQQP
jgi:tripartite-type tricarboxylate transporter receptor subunit TctC